MVYSLPWPDSPVSGSPHWVSAPFGSRRFYGLRSGFIVRPGRAISPQGQTVLPWSRSCQALPTGLPPRTAQPGRRFRGLFAQLTSVARDRGRRVNPVAAGLNRRCARQDRPRWRDCTPPGIAPGASSSRRRANATLHRRQVSDHYRAKVGLHPACNWLSFPTDNFRARELC